MRDGEVVASIVAGDPAGLAEAYDRYADALFGYCRSLLREPADAADVVHDTFVIAAVSLRQLRDPQRLRPWLYAVARNLALRKLRANKAAAVYPALGADGDIDGDVDGDGDVGDDVERAELRALLLAATGGLNSREREIIELRLWQGLDIGEAAAVIGISRTHAHSLLYRARNQLTASVGVLLVARSGRGDCAVLDGMLRGWDGHLTVLMRKRLSRHIEHCDVCADRRKRELRPALLTLWPAGALAAAVAGEHARHAAAIPAGLKDQVLRAAAAKNAGAAGARGVFLKSGFPQRRSRTRTLATCGAAGAAAALLALVLVGRAHEAVLFLDPAVGGHPGASPSVYPAGGGPTSPGGVPGQGGRAGAGAAGPTPVITVVPVAASSGAVLPTTATPTTARPTTVPPTTVPPTTVPPTTVPPTTVPPTTVPPTTVPPTTVPPTTVPPTTVPPTTVPPTTVPPTTVPPTTVPPTTVPPTTPPATGTLAVSPTTIVLAPLLGSTLTLTAQNGPVTWSIAVPASLVGELTVSPAAGTLAAGESAQVTISVTGLASLDTTLTVNPGGQQVTVLLGVG